jgi:transcriptional regulator with XRE-family HTH domain
MAKIEFEKRFPARDSAAVKALAANIRRLRKLKGWSQDRLAAELQVDQNAISLLENGRANPTLIMIEDVARVLGVRFTDLLEVSTRARKKE